MTVSVYAPASIGNISVGFDVLGMAVTPVDGSLLGDVVSVCKSDVDVLEVVGQFADKLPANPKENIVWDCLTLFNQKLSAREISVQTVSLSLDKKMPVGSGLGSSACSVVAALEALNQFYNTPFNRSEMLYMMGQMEAQISGSLHYDNVAPCYYGGIQLMVSDEARISQTLPALKDCYWIMAYPGIEVSTKMAREVLPESYSRADVIKHGQNLATFVDACYRGAKNDALSAISDVVAEPYRKGLLPGFSEAKEYLLSNGAQAVGISGSGPTMFVAVSDLATAESLQKYLVENYLSTAQGFSHICKTDEQGARAI